MDSLADIRIKCKYFLISAKRRHTIGPVVDGAMRAG
jgi:hypothetical protein